MKVIQIAASDVICKVLFTSAVKSGENDNVGITLVLGVQKLRSLRTEHNSTIDQDVEVP